MVRLVFRPYTHFWRSICTSESLRASIRVSSDFALSRHSSPSFGSQQICSASDHLALSRTTGRQCRLLLIFLPFHFHFAFRFEHPTTRIFVALLGPCYKTGRLKPFCQQPSCRKRHSNIAKLLKTSLGGSQGLINSNLTRRNILQKTWQPSVSKDLVLGDYNTTQRVVTFPQDV